MGIKNQVVIRYTPICTTEWHMIPDTYRSRLIFVSQFQYL